MTSETKKPCEEIREKFSPYLDGELDEHGRAAMNDHFRGCSTCWGELAGLQRALAALKEHGPVAVPEGFEARVLGRLRPPAQPSGVIKARRWLHTRVPVWIPLAAAAAALILFVPVLAALLGSLAGRGREIEQLREQARQVRESPPAATPADSPPIPAPVASDPREAVEKFVRERGLVPFGESYLPRDLAEHLQQGRCFVNGEWLTYEQVAARFEKPAPAPAPPTPPSRPAAEIAVEWLEANGYVKVAEGYVPRPVADALVAGRHDDSARLLQEFMAKHDLVEHEGRVVSRAHRDALLFEREIAKPDGATPPLELERLLHKARIGLPTRAGAISAYPIFAGSPSPVPEFTTLHESGAVVSDAGTAFWVSISNPSDQPMFVPAGTVLAGGNFSRVTLFDAWIPARGGTRLRVYCAQPQGLANRSRFLRDAGPLLAPPSIRRSLTHPQGQAVVWTLVEAYASVLKPQSATPGIEELYTAPEASRRIATAQKAMAEFLAANPRARGVAFAVKDHVILVEIFATRKLLESHWNALVASVALEEALAQTIAGLMSTQIPNAFHELRRFTQQAWIAEVRPGETSHTLWLRGTFLGELCTYRLNGPAVALTLYPPAEAISDVPGLMAATAGMPARKIERILSEAAVEIARAPAGGKAAWLREIEGIGGSRATATILKFTRDADASVRNAAIDAAGARGDPAAAPELLALFKAERKDQEQIERLCAAMARLGDERCTDAMIKKLADPDPQISAIVLPYLPEAILKLRSKAAAEKATTDLINYFESAYNIYWRPPESVTEEMRQRFRLAYTHALEALIRLTGQEFKNPTEPRAWWKQNREAFLRKVAGP